MRRPLPWATLQHLLLKTLLGILQRANMRGADLFVKTYPVLRSEATARSLCATRPENIDWLPGDKHG